MIQSCIEKKSHKIFLLITSKLYKYFDREMDVDYGGLQKCHFLQICAPQTLAPQAEH